MNIEDKQAAVSKLLSEFVDLNPAVVMNKDYNGYNAWSHALRTPTFVGQDGFAKAVDALEGVLEWPTYARDPETGIERALDYKTLVGSRTRETISVNTASYRTVLDQDVFAPVSAALAGHDFNVFGRFDGDSGKTVAHLFLMGDDFEFGPERGHEWKDDPTQLGIRIHNSYNTEMAYGMGFFGVRKACTNYAIQDALLGAVRFKHAGAVKSIAAQFERLIEDILNSVGLLTDRMTIAANTELSTLDAVDLLWGIDLPLRGIEAIRDAPYQLVPEARTTEKWNAYLLYNAATAYITYRPNGLKHLAATRGHTDRAAKLLQVSTHDRLIEAGRARRESYEAARKAAQRERIEIEVRA